MGLRPGDSVDQPVSIYVDVTTVPVRDGWVVTMVDLDLDVILGRDGSLVLDDEDEFDRHRVTLDYPPDVVARAKRATADLMAAAADGQEPFGSAATGWLSWLGRAGQLPAGELTCD